MSHVETGSLLRAARRTRGVTVAEAGEKFGVSPSTITRWEAGKHLPSASVVNEYLRRIGASPLELDRVGERKGRVSLRVLRAKRRRSQVTLQDLSLTTGFSVATLHRYETGERQPDPSALLRIADAYGIPAHEQRLLADDGLFRGSVMERFLTPEGGGHIWLYRRFENLLDRASPLTADEISEIVHAFLIMGDHRGLIEAWTDLKPATDQLALSEHDRIILRLSLAMARYTVDGDRVAATRRISRWRDREDLPSRAMSYLSRFAYLVGEFDEADRWLERLTRHSTRHGDHDQLFVCELNRLGLEFARSRSRTLLSDLERLRECVAGPLQSYTLTVAEIWMLAALGELEEARKRDGECRATEDVYGFGSPLAFGLRKRKLRRSA